MIDKTIPEGLRGMHPAAVLAQRMTNAHGSAWLVVTYDADYPNSRGEDGHAAVYWFPRASHWNCRPCCVADYWGEGALDKALARAAEEETTGPDRSVALRPASKPTRPRDVQRAKLYKWERTLKSRKGEAAQTIFSGVIREACDVLGEECPPIKWTSRHGAAAWHNGQITCGKASATRQIGLHELAHILCYRWHGWRNDPGHGAQFVAVFIGLLALFAGEDLEDLYASAKAAGLKVGDIPQKLRLYLNDRLTPRIDALELCARLAADIGD